MGNPWETFGKRVHEARRDVRWTQQELASAMDMDRTVVSKIESGQRTVDSMELARLAAVLRRPIAWFVTEPPPSVVSRRAEREVSRMEDVQLEMLAQDVEQLIEIGVLHPVQSTVSPPHVRSIDDAESAAREARRRAELDDEEPVWDILRVVEQHGLYAFVLPIAVDDGAHVDGSYVALARAGVALIGSGRESGRKRFTVAHELGHHVLADAYASEWMVDGGATERERIINAFAIHFLMPRKAVERAFKRSGADADLRGVAIRLAVEYGTSWSATCTQLERCGPSGHALFERLVHEKPTSFELAERGLTIRDDTRGPLVPSGYAKAVVAALKKNRIGPNRALELLHDTVLARDLPPAWEPPLETMVAELEPLPEQPGGRAGIR